MKNWNLHTVELALAVALMPLSVMGCVSNPSTPAMDSKLQVTAALDCTSKGVAISFTLVNGTNRDETMPAMALPWARGFVVTHLEIQNKKTGEIIKGVPPISDYFEDTTIPAHGTLHGQVRLNLLFDQDKLLSLEKNGEAILVWTYSAKTNIGTQVNANGELPLSAANGGPSCN